VNWDIQSNEIFIFTDGGRLCRPLFYYDQVGAQYSFNKKQAAVLLRSDTFHWQNLVGCKDDKSIKEYENDTATIYTPMTLYGVEDIVKLQNTRTPDIVEYLDT
jgi:hypothetical protein